MRERRLAAAHAFVADLDAPILDDADEHHLVRVLRLAPGETVTVSDGAGRWCACRHRGGGALERVSDIHTDLPRSPRITVAFALVKGDRPEWIVQKLTELGVDAIVPVRTARTVVRWDGDRAVRHVERLRRVAREAAMQSRQVWLPVVEDVAAFDTVAARPGTCVAEPGGGRLSLDHPTVVVGPEGGFTPDELEVGAPLVALPGGGILRTDTAAVVAAVGLVTLRDS